MNEAVVYRDYRAGDEQEVVALWNACLPRDEITLTTYRRKLILDPNFDVHGCPVAIAGGRIVGFLLAIRRRYPYFDIGIEPGKGWITVFFVHHEFRRQGIGTSLLERGEAFLRAHGIREVSVADYTPNYIVPGIDLDESALGHAFLASRGYHGDLKVYGMGRSLLDVTLPPDVLAIQQRLGSNGFSISVFSPSYTLLLLDFLRQHYPGDLYRVALERLTDDPECDEILVALKDGEIVGFSHFLEERFGPFGIHPNYGGRGLGPLLYYATVEQMKKKGRRNLWLAWTTGHAKDFYYRLGLRVSRRHLIMRKGL
jgi:mycothiol synthase